MAAVCCNACRTCVTTNIVAILGTALAGAGSRHLAGCSPPTRDDRPGTASPTRRVRPPSPVRPPAPASLAAPPVTTGRRARARPRARPRAPARARPPARHGHGHSHGLVDRSIVRSHEGVKAVSISLVVLAIAAAAQLAIFALSGSVALLADLIHNFGDALTAIPLGIAFYPQERARASGWPGSPSCSRSSPRPASLSTRRSCASSIRSSLTHLWVLAGAGRSASSATSSPLGFGCRPDDASRARR